MTKITACVWCSKIMTVPDIYDDLRHKGVCCQSCKDAENLFNLYWSDEEINRRAHYKKLTEGGDEQEDKT